MKKKYIALLSLSLPFLQGCYPGWQNVKIEPSVINKPCEYRGRESCEGSFTKCNVWFKKRATKVSANTIVWESDSEYTSGRYYSCRPGLPRYEKLKFTKEGYGQGSNTVTGQAFLRQKGGGIVTCAGRKVIIYPNTIYFEAMRDATKDVEVNQELSAMRQVALCDAEGDFEFTNIQDGEWYVETTVSWDVPEVVSVGYYTYITSNRQGGIMRKTVEVDSNKKNRFIISDHW